MGSALRATFTVTETNSGGFSFRAVFNRVAVICPGRSLGSLQRHESGPDRRQEMIRSSTRQRSFPLASSASTDDPGSASRASVKTRPSGSRRTTA
jgi:hypothetical protein